MYYETFIIKQTCILTRVDIPWQIFTNSYFSLIKQYSKYCIILSRLTFTCFEFYSPLSTFLGNFICCDVTCSGRLDPPPPQVCSSKYFTMWRCQYLKFFIITLLKTTMILYVYLTGKILIYWSKKETPSLCFKLLSMQNWEKLTLC